MDRVYIGTELKFKVIITSPGFDMTNDPFSITLKNGGRSISFQKQDLSVDGQGNYYLCFNTKDIGTGTVEMLITAKVPDSAFPDGYRDEVDKKNLVIISAV